MRGWKILPVILNYNQPEEADRIYNKLVNDGFKDIISADNGSDLKPRAKSANLILPKNIKAVGIAKMVLIYAMDYFPADYYWIINTSSELLDEVNYKEHLDKTITEIKDKNLYAGIISPSLVSDEAMRHQRFKADSEEVYSICCWCECIAPLVSHELLEINRKNSSGFFEPQAQRGWVTTHEMGFEAAQNGLWWVLDHKLPVKWNKNLGYKSKVGGESLNNYQQQAASEMKDILKKKHGLLWRFKIYTNFIKSIKDKKLPFDIAPYDPFGVWKLFFSLNKNQKPVKSPAYFCLF